MLIKYDGKRYGFSYNDVKCGELKRIQDLYGLSIKDVQSFDIQKAKGSVVTSLYWLTLCQNDVKIHLEAVKCKIIPFLDAFIDACNDSVYHPPPKINRDVLQVGGSFMPEGVTETDRIFLRRMQETEMAKKRQFAEKAENANFSKLYAEYVLDFAFHLHLSPAQVEDMRWHEFFSCCESLQQNRNEIRKQNAAASASGSEANQGFRV